MIKTGAAFAGAAPFSPLYSFASQSPARQQPAPRKAAPRIKIFDVLKYGATGDGKTLDSPAFQRAVDDAAAFSGKAQVLVRGGHKYLIGTIELKGSIDFHLADDAQLLISTQREDYRGGLPGSQSGDTMSAALGAVIMANGAQGLKISGTGTLQGRAKEFMTGYDDPGGIWKPGPFRPKMFVLTACKDLQVRDITFAEAPNWGLHLLGCDGVLVDNVKIRNLLDVPNCDGIDPDHSRNVEIRNCNIACGDDGVVIKCSRQPIDYGECANIHVHDCVIETQDAGLKIGTETTSDIHDIRFERCHIKTSSRGLCIQLRDEGNVYNIAFRDITFNSRFYSDPWWGRGEAISFTAIPRSPASKPGSLHHVTVQNVTGTAENSVRVCGSALSRIHDVTLDRVAVTLARTTKFPGGLFDNRPTTAIPAIQPHDTPGFSIEHADNVTLRNCKVAWGANLPDAFSYAVEAIDTTGLKIEGLTGTAAHTSLRKAVSIS
ncbi:MAG TPA: glycosyl hydrolase family 28 protein [Acidobacteriaceae bacterium]|nr:glycosyl hydrolase family 28 protein [Acidobacteriaceae bacterium]